MNYRLKIGVVTLLTCFLFISCGEQKSSDEQTTPETKPKVEEKIEVEKVPAVCVWDRGSVRDEPRKKGKYISALSLGEKVNWLSETKIDTSDKNKKYHLIELSDGTTGWSSEYVLAINAKPAISIKEIPIYKRPDLLTLKESSFSKMEFLAVLKTEGKWLEVVGKEKKKKGWINSEDLSYNDEDIAVGLLANKALAQKDSEAMKEQIEAIVKNPAFSNSVFLGDLKTAMQNPDKKLKIDQ